MPGFSTVGGGHHHHHHPYPPPPHLGYGLSGTERAAAQNALAKLGASGKGPSHDLGVSDLARGPLRIPALKQLTGGLVAGKGTDTYAGGASLTRLPGSGLGADTVVGGSTGIRTAFTENSAAFRLSSDTINLAGTTAAAVKALDPTLSQQSSHTITLSDKTTLTISGVHSSDIIKPHGH